MQTPLQFLALQPTDFLSSVPGNVSWHRCPDLVLRSDWSRARCDDQSSARNLRDLPISVTTAEDVVIEVLKASASVIIRENAFVNP